MPARQGASGHEITLCEEDIADISLATFHVFDKEKSPRLRARIAAGGCVACATSESVNQPTGGGPAYAPRPRTVRPAQPYVRAIRHPQAPANQNANQKAQPDAHSTTNRKYERAYPTGRRRIDGKSKCEPTGRGRSARSWGFKYLELRALRRGGHGPRLLSMSFWVVRWIDLRAGACSSLGSCAWKLKQNFIWIESRRGGAAPHRNALQQSFL